MVDALLLRNCLTAAVLTTVHGYHWNVDTIFNCSKAKCQWLAERKMEGNVGCLVLEISFGLTSGCVVQYSDAKHLYSAIPKTFVYRDSDRGFAECIENRCDRYCGAMHYSPGVCQSFSSQQMTNLKSQYKIVDDSLTACVCTETRSALTTTTLTLTLTTTTTPTTSSTSTTTTTPPTTTTTSTTPTTTTTTTTKKPTTSTTTTSTTTTTTKTTRKPTTTTTARRPKTTITATVTTTRTFKSENGVTGCNEDYCKRLCKPILDGAVYACKQPHCYAECEDWLMPSSPSPLFGSVCSCHLNKLANARRHPEPDLNSREKLITCDAGKCHQYCVDRRRSGGKCVKYNYNTLTLIPSCKCN